ncbi:MAG: hypothetical protein A3J75_06365 [Acidobacteria bacterium RBG_16_68_9]|nr:MAG: hypothetical protein A3J75_06365 [Acidobacteria bacterium RBG_16_68_9]
MSRTAELAAELDRAGLTAAAPIEQQLVGVAESRWVPPEHLVPAAAAARRAGFFFESMTCTDRLAAHGALELLYTFNRYDEPPPPARLAVRVWVPHGMSVPTLTRVYGIAEWNEREAWEFYGIRFAGHPNLTWLLLPEGTEFHPLLKSFTAPPPSAFDDSLSAARGAPNPAVSES